MKITVIGLGYVGLPVALAFAKKFPNTVGFEISAQRVKDLKAGKDATEEFTSAELAESSLSYTTDIEDIVGSDLFVIAVPTPVDENNTPDLSPLRSASTTVGKAIRKGGIAVFESTVYPGVTEDYCGPIIAETSGLECGKDFFLGYSPERINPGDKEHTIDKIVKVVSAQDEQSLQRVADAYGAIITAGIHKAPSIKVAEAAKVIENTQRDLNIALMNELALIFDQMEIRTVDVLEAAGTKWNFIGYRPGLVGGHCIGVDPYYLTTAAERFGYHPQVILAGRRI
ncbi:MAG: nucleotide sugar dehydrogenase, partial [Bdellovibrionales bacterium]|nr:nucleotide sugar dehydrogenase [Bdellovibrionales bacterium]